MIPTPCDIAERWLAAFNRKDMNALLDLYLENAEHYSPKLKMRQPETGGFIKGKDALRRWWNDAFERLPSLHYEPVTITCNNERVWMEYRRTVSGEPDLMVAEVLEIAQGKISTSRVYHG